MDLNIKCKTIKLEETEKTNYELEKKNTCTYPTRDKYQKYIKSTKTQCLKKIHLEERHERCFTKETIQIKPKHMKVCSP